MRCINPTPLQHRCFAGDPHLDPRSRSCVQGQPGLSGHLPQCGNCRPKQVRTRETGRRAGNLQMRFQRQEPVVPTFGQRGEHLGHLAVAFAYQGPPRGRSVGIVTNAGGPGILATDGLERAGMQIARLTVETRAALSDCLPSAAAVGNPVDVLGDAKADQYEAAIHLTLADPNVDGLLVILTPQAMTEIEETAMAVGDVAKTAEKPVLACFMGEARVNAGVELLREADVPNYMFPERAAVSFAAMEAYRSELERPIFEPEACVECIRLLSRSIARSSHDDLAVRLEGHAAGSVVS